MLVLTEMNYANKEALYEEAKTSLKKFKGDFTEGKTSSNLSKPFLLRTKRHY